MIQITFNDKKSDEETVQWLRENEEQIQATVKGYNSEPSWMHYPSLTALSYLQGLIDDSVASSCFEIIHFVSGH